MNKIIIVHYEEDPEAIEAFEMAAEKLWSQHVNFTRQAIISILAGLDDTLAVTERLMKNQEDIGMAIVPYYGEAAAAELTRLLKEHIMIASNIVKSIKDSKSTTELELTWQNNADAIATFLDSADSEHWPKETVLGILKKHMECTLKQATSRVAKDWAGDIAAYEECCANIYTLADAFYEGIVQKFPELFVMQYSSRTIKKK